jgi:four helix bundle protein
MPRVQKFEDLEVWKKARSIVSEIYAMTNVGPFSKDFGLKDQIRRSAVSIMSNIAEGFERDGDREFVNFLSIAKGSAGETRSLLYVSKDQNYISESRFDRVLSQLTECSRMIGGLSSYLRQSELKGVKFKSR